MKIEILKRDSDYFFSRKKALANKLNMERDEFMSMAYIGFCKAQKVYDPKKAGIRTHYNTFAKQEIHQAIKKIIMDRKRERGLHIGIPTYVYKSNLRYGFCFKEIMDMFDDELDHFETNILTMLFCDNISLYKIAKSYKLCIKDIYAVMRKALNKMKTKITEFGEVEDADDLQWNLAVMYHYKKAEKEICLS